MLNRQSQRLKSPLPKRSPPARTNYLINKKGILLMLNRHLINKY